MSTRKKSGESASDLINSAVRATLAEDADDLATVRARAREPNLRFEDVLEHLKHR